jgi:hypothetical protein
LGLGGVLEALGHLGLGVRRIAFRIQRGLTTLGGGEDDFSASVLEDVVRGGEFFEPEAGGFAGVAELVVGCEHDENFHGVSF